jgi:hypothetical protein
VRRSAFSVRGAWLVGRAWACGVRRSATGVQRARAGAGTRGVRDCVTYPSVLPSDGRSDKTPNDKKRESV